MRLGKLSKSWILTSAFILLAASTGLSAKAQEKITVIRGGTLIDGNGGPPREDVSIVIEGNRIRTISQGAAAQVPPGARVIAAAGKYIVPGLWDTHVHYHDWFPELLITNGVTSVLNYSRGPWNYVQAEGTAKGKILGPRFFQSREHIGDAYMIEDKDLIASKIVKSREEAVRQVRQLVSEGADIIKVYTTVTPEILEAVASEAHRNGLLVSGHIGIPASQAARAGIDNLSTDSFLGVKEAAALAGVEKPNFIRDYARRPDFPKPLIQVASGPIWFRPQVEEFLRRSKKREARPSKERAS